MQFQQLTLSVTAATLLASVPAIAVPFSFSTGNPDGLMAMATRPETPGQFEIETADDFVLANPTRIKSATFTGIMPQRGTIGRILPDLQAWTRDEMLQPDWLRVGADIVGAGAFNATFSLAGRIPEPSSLAIFAAGLIGLGFLGWRQRKVQ
jgi:hypothetical protein